MTATYFIRAFDSDAGAITVEFMQQQTTTRILLPVDAEGKAPVGEELNNFILNFVPQHPQPFRPITNASEIQSLVVPSPPHVPTWTDLRPWRDRELAACDWVTLADVQIAPDLKDQWLSYRQQLRDLPATYPDASQVVWPNPPVG